MTYLMILIRIRQDLQCVGVKITTCIPYLTPRYRIIIHLPTSSPPHFVILVERERESETIHPVTSVACPNFFKPS